ncbi:MAG TPA: acylphosphatase [Burkholderiales bacterium]|jgi:acylphosphatase|nr:acylphosphatase [Burkholderiales bacterium]
METRRLRIRGRVQGVGYREALRTEAEHLGLRGWVRNRADGSVEALVQGLPAALDGIAAWARRGPPLAQVETVQTELLADAPGEAPGFRRMPTA